MKDFFYSIFIWISGADTNLLKDCPESEHKKYALQGGLILIPSIMAFVSMLYTTSLLTDDIAIRLTLTFIWAGFIFIIDRYIVATFIKKEQGGDWFSVQFFIRIIFAIGLGIVISHPVIIRVFDDKITETQTEIWKDIKDTTQDEVFEDRDAINKPLQSRVDTLTKELDIIRKVISAEIVGANTIIGGYYVSNLPGSGTRVAKLANDTVTIGSEIRELKKEIKTNEDNAILKRDSIIVEKQETLAKGYWGKDDALTIYLDKKDKWAKYWFILMFFIFVDVTAVLLKAFTQYGEYDSKLTQRQDNRIRHKEHVWTRWLRKKEHLIDRDCEWEKTKIDEIFASDGNYNGIKIRLDEAGIFYDEEDKKPEGKNIFQPIITGFKGLPQEKYFSVIVYISVIIGISNAVAIYLKGNQVSIINGAVFSMPQAFIVTLCGTVFANLITHKITRKPQTEQNS
ncbi:MAG: DUF4407 domain-containing protein [Tannerella sp.]|jgi:hypothetical protein|nr:DUF4407 domain-containing protein [Tannerella sp.]